MRYFGPFGHAYAIRETLDALTRVFPVRTCSNAFFDQRARARRPCLYYDIGRCSGPCVPEVTGATEEGYRADVDALADFLAGNERPVLQRLEREMRRAAEREEFELAAKLRDQLAAARRALESQEMVLTQPEDLDVIGLVEDDLESSIQAFFVRKGRVKGRKGWVADRVEELDRSQLVGSFVRDLYMERQEVPPGSWCPRSPADADLLTEWLSSRRGGRVAFAVPERGAKRKLMETVVQNAREHFQRHKLRRASDFGARSRALSELGAILGLEQAPLRIECYDISNLGSDRQGRVDGGVRGRAAQAIGLPALRDQGRPGAGRLREHGGDAPAPVRPAATGAGGAPSRKRRRFSYPPALLVVDGGRGQLSVATKVLADAGLHIPAVGLAKRLEEVYFPDRPDPLLVPRGSEALFVLQHLRDEAHRFAITYHRQRRARRALARRSTTCPASARPGRRRSSSGSGPWPGWRARTSRRSRTRRASGRRSPAPCTSG